MVRSFTDRVLGGVCGGLAARVGINSWWVRAAFIFLTILSTGAFAVLYVLLWWSMPQQSFIGGRRAARLPLALVLLLTLLVIAIWIGRDMGWLRGPTGQELYWPAMALLLSVVFFLRQVRP